MLCGACGAPSTQAPAEAVAVASAPAAVAPSAEPAAVGILGCPPNQTRQFACGQMLEARTACPEDPSGLEDRDEVASARHRDPRARLVYDAPLSGVYAANLAHGCCYSACVPLETHGQAVSTHEYRQTQCVLAPGPDASEPGCAPAVRFPDDYFDHIAAFDAAETARHQALYDARPVLGAVAFCCYGAAPMSAIGPM